MEIIPIKKEVLGVVWCCDSSKALGYDGFNIKFIKEMWNSIGQEVCQLIAEFF